MQYAGESPASTRGVVGLVDLVSWRQLAGKSARSTHAEGAERVCCGAGLTIESTEPRLAAGRDLQANHGTWDVGRGKFSSG